MNADKGNFLVALTGQDLQCGGHVPSCTKQGTPYRVEIQFAQDRYVAELSGAET